MLRCDSPLQSCVLELGLGGAEAVLERRISPSSRVSESLAGLWGIPKSFPSRPALHLSHCVAQGLSLPFLMHLSISPSQQEEGMIPFPPKVQSLREGQDPRGGVSG